MKSPRAMNETWPEFVIEEEDGNARAVTRADLTGWETVVFELEEDQDDGSSAFSTAALAP